MRDERSIVIDGRDGWLSTIAFHAVHDAVAAGGDVDARLLAARVWARFADTTDLGRPAAHGVGYSRRDAERKVADKLRLLAQERLPPRALPAIEAAYQAPVLGVEPAREHLASLIATACGRIEIRHADPSTLALVIGIKATVGLGKSTAARRRLLALRSRLVAAGAPARLLILVPSHVLAEEVAAAWRAEAVRTAVLRGYEAMDPGTRTPMCRDVSAVKAAIEARLDVHETACSSSGRRCAFFDGCLKQRNRAEVAGAEVVVAAHQALFTGFAIDAGSIAAIVVDERLWSSALREKRMFGVDAFPHETLVHVRGSIGDDADLHDLRCRALAAFDGRAGRAARGCCRQGSTRRAAALLPCSRRGGFAIRSSIRGCRRRCAARPLPGSL